MKPTGYVDDDKPVCKVEDLAVLFGITEDEVCGHVSQLEAARGERLLQDDEEVTLDVLGADKPTGNHQEARG